jgi:hypothetical protein
MKLYLTCALAGLPQNRQIRTTATTRRIASLVIVVLSQKDSSSRVRRASRRDYRGLDSQQICVSLTQPSLMAETSEAKSGGYTEGLYQGRGRRFRDNLSYTTQQSGRTSAHTRS